MRKNKNKTPTHTKLQIQAPIQQMKDSLWYEYILI